MRVSKGSSKEEDSSYSLQHEGLTTAEEIEDLEETIEEKLEKRSEILLALEKRPK